jgi:hypothetical protein
VFTDAYSAGRGQVDIVDSVYPDFVESTILELPEPTIKRSAANGDRNYTSMAYTANNTLTTFQLDFDNFTGNVIAQGSETQIGPDWYDIGLQTVYTNQNTRSYINIDGRHNWIRFQLNQYGLSGEGVATVANGAVTAITSAGGSEWFGAGNPNVDIEGNPGGTGATATATLNSNSVGSITVTNGGQGYIEVPLVKINNGRITQILYR